MKYRLPLSTTTDSPLLLGEAAEGVGVRSNTKRQIEVTMFAAGVKEIKELEHWKLLEQW